MTSHARRIPGRVRTRPLGGRLRRGLAPAAAAAALAVTLAAPTATNADVVVFHPEQVIRFDGQGWGHGVGMSQWGARGRALAGQAAEEIVRAYYSGTEISDAPTDQTPIRVLISQGYRPGAIDGSQPSSNQLAGDIIGQGGEWAILGATGPLPPGAKLRLLDHPGQPRVTVRLFDAAGQHMLDFDLPGSMEVIPLQPETRLQVFYKPTAPAPGGEGRFYDVYRGSVRVHINAEGLIDTVNVLSIEDYLRGVVPAEMPNHWPAEALKAQALAARTYALTSLNPANPSWDVDDTTTFQAYLGVTHEKPETDAAIRATARRILTYQAEPIRAYFFSTSNGHTESNEDVFGDQPLPYLRAVQDLDPSGRPWDAESPRSQWSTQEFPLAALSEMFTGNPALAVGSVRSLDFTRRTVSGRMIEVGIEGSQRSFWMNAWDFVTRFNRETSPAIGPLLSTRFTVVFQYPLTRAEPALNLPGGQSIYFDETGHNVRHGFLTYFLANGGAGAFGLPLTEEFIENGLTVQYFQRARFEFHPEHAGTRYAVELGLIGDELTEHRRPFQGVAPFPSEPEHRYFPETGHSVNFAFLRFWEQAGALDRFGYPISEEVVENGVSVQYFQRARFEYRPELPQPVRLGDIGSELLRSRGLLP